MKKFLSALILCVLATAGFSSPNVGDVKLSQVTNASPAAYKDVFITPVNSGLWGFDSSGHPVGITLGANLALSGTTLNATGGGGSGNVTSVALSAPDIYTVSGSPVTTSGTLTFSLNNQSAGLFFAGPGTGSAAPPTFRAIVATDVPIITSSKISDFNTAAAAAAPVQSVAGRTGTVTLTKSDVGLGNVENTALSTWAGSTNLTTLGTIGTGTWNATAIADGKIASALTGKTYNGVTPTALATGFSLAGGTTSKTVTFSNTLTLSGTDGSTLNIGAGGTLGALAYSTDAANLTGTIGSGRYGATTIPISAINATGTPSSTTALFGDGSWKTVSGGGGGSVTSVGLAAPSDIFTVTNSPVTVSGTLTISENTQSANTVWAGPTTGSAATPAFRALVAADLPGIGANPSATVGTTAVNGSATTYLRSDSAPALNLGITPTWTGAHVFSSGLTSKSQVVITGNTASTTAISPSLLYLAGTDSTAAAMTMDAFGSTPTIRFRQAQGTGASPSATQSGNVLGQFSARGFGATVYNTGSRASLSFYATENYTDSANGTRIGFNVTANGGTSLAERFSINNDGTLTASAYGAGVAVFDSSGNVSSGIVPSGSMPALTGDVTSSAGSTVTTLANIPSGVVQAGSVLATAIAAPSTPSTGNGSIYVDSTSKNLAVKNDAGTVNHGVQTKSAVSHQFITSIADDGSSVIAQPAFSDISGSVASTQMPALTGDVTSSAGSTATTVGKINGVSLASLGTGLLKNTTTTGVPSIAVAADVPNLGANPSALIGLTAVNGSATTYHRSDSAPALDQSIAPTWTGAHQFNAVNPITLGSTATGGIDIYNTVDQVTNTEFGQLAWSSNIFNVGTLSAGTGSSRAARFGVITTGATQYLNVQRTSPYYQYSGSAITGTTGMSYVSITPTWNTSSTSADTDLLINRTETSIGSGLQFLADFQVAGTSKFQVDRLGNTNIASTATGGLRVFNTTDQITNTESLQFNWASNTAQITAQAGGTGTARNIKIGNGQASETIRASGSGSGIINFTLPTTSTAGNVVMDLNNYISTSTSGSNVGIRFTPTYNQSSSTAANTDFLINRTETSLGSGTQNFLDFQVAASSKLAVRNTGQIVSAVATGTAPFTIASTTNVANLNASSLNGATFAAPGAIGSGTASTGAFTSVTSSGTIQVTGTGGGAAGSAFANSTNGYAIRGLTGSTYDFSLLTQSGGAFVFSNPTGTSNIMFAGAAVSSSATSGIGYTTGAGGAVTQTTSRTTGVTLNTVSGAITLVSAVGLATYQTFTVTDSAVAATDTVSINQKSGTDIYIITVHAVATGSFQVSYATTGGTTTEQPVFQFNVIKGSNS